MDAKHDQHFMCKILKILCRTCVFFCKKYPVPICILLLFFVSYLFFPWVFTFLIIAFPLAGLSFLVHRIFLGIDRQDIKRVEEDDRRKKFAKSRRSFKSTRSQLVRRNATKNGDDYDKDDIFSKSLNELLFEKKSKEIQEVNVESIAGKGEFSSLKSNIDKDEMEGENLDISEDEDNDEPQDKAVRWTEDDQKNVMDLGFSEAERNKRLESLMERRRSRKNLGFEEGGSTGNINNVQISAIKTTKINPFLERISRGTKSPGSAPCSWLKRHNPFDLPYDPHEEKLDLSGDIFHEEFNIGHQKEPPIFCRHESFSLGTLSHPEMAHDKHEISFYKDPATKEKPYTRFGTSTVDNGGQSSKQRVGVHYKEVEYENKNEEVDAHLDASNAEEGEFQRNVDSYEARKADIVFFYGGNKRIGRYASSHSLVSDLQVEYSDEGSGRALDDLDIEKDKEGWLNSSNVSEADLEVVKEDGEKDNTMEGHDVVREYNPGTISDQETVDKQSVSESNHIHESSEASQSSVVHNAPDGLTEVAVGRAPATTSSPKSVLQREYSTDPASPHNHANEDQTNRRL